MRTVLVTGAAGFIGHHVSRALLDRGDKVVGVDNLNDYYDVSLKEARLAQNQSDAQFTFERLDCASQEDMHRLFESYAFNEVIHLAAQAGVRYSIENPLTYINSNIVGFAHILEGCRRHKIRHLVYASSSSVYGANTHLPFSIHDNVDHPISLYAASKKANELMAHSYSHLYRLPTTGLRFFTVYGPWGRPDMAIFLFTKAISEGRAIDIFNHGDMKRDFTYIDDIVEGVIRTMDRPAGPNEEWSGDTPDPGTSKAPYRLYNIGSSQSVHLMHLIEVIERLLGMTAQKNFLPIQPGDVPETFADLSGLRQDIGFSPQISIEEGVEKFIAWYRSHYSV